MHHLPAGTVTMLFTDIEGSTHLLEQLDKRYPDVLAQYRSLLRTTFHAHSGQEVDTQGDSFFVVFARATDAISAAVEVQRAVFAHAWPDDVKMRVRIGLHTGQPQLAPEGYVGLDVHHAARIMSAGHGGQVLLSAATCELVKHDLPGGVGLRDLGDSRLKDLQHPSHLFQLLIAGLPTDFPPLKTLDSHPNNLPVQPTPFIGRDQQVAAIVRLLNRDDLRLLTLTGPGGTGKTRLGLQVAAELSDTFTNGVYFVNLAPLSDPALVIPTIAQTLTIKEIAGQSLLDVLKGSLHWKHLLLVLDNFEQVIDAAVDVAHLLAACPNLKVLVTSRMSLHVRGEQEFAVPPLTVPDPRHLDLVTLSQYEAVALFIARAQAVKSEFLVTNASAPAIAEICTRLDGLPLAIELATARLKLLPPQALLARLGQRLAVLTSGARDAPARQQTLRNTIKWSYDLLDPQEQKLFRWLSVFVGGCTLEAIEAVWHDASDEKIDVLDTVALLIDNNLVRQIEQEAGEPRLNMLETIREYALDCLHENKEAEVCQRTHAMHYLALAEEAEPYLKGAQQVLWWKRLEKEQENLRAALAWLIDQEEGELALRLSGALWWFWNIRGYWSEGWRWLEALLELPQAQERTAWRAKALIGAAEFANRLGHLVSRSLHEEESVIIYRELGDKRGLAESLGYLGLSMSTQNNVAAGRALLEEGLGLAREVGDPWALANALRNLGDFMSDFSDFKSARIYFEESSMLYRELKDSHALSGTLLDLTEVAVSEGNLTQAAALALESHTLARKLDNRPDIIRALRWLAITKGWQGDTGQAVALLEEGLALAREQGYKWQIGNTVHTLGTFALYQGDLQQAETYGQESLRLFRELHNKERTAIALAFLGDIRRIQGDLAQARSLCTEGVLLAREVGIHSFLGSSLISLAKVASAEGQPEQAARLFGAAEYRINPSTELDPFERADYEQVVEGVREQLSEKAFTTAWVEGRAMTPEQVLASLKSMEEPISRISSATQPAKLPNNYPDGLTTREIEVLRFVAQGLTNDQVAEQLVISPRTVNSHLTSIYSKIGVTSRAAATRYAFEHHLV